MTEYLKLVVSDEDFTRPDFEYWLGQMAVATNQENSRRYRTALELYQNTLTRLIKLYGEKSRQVRYLNNEGVPNPPNIDRQHRKILRDYDAWYEKKARKERLEQNKIRREAKRQAEAEAHRVKRAKRLPFERELRYRSKATIDELRLAGFEPVTDFKSTQAISFARRFVWQAKVDENWEGQELEPLVLV